MDSPGSKKAQSSPQSIWNLARQTMQIPTSGPKRRAAAARSSSIVRARGVERCLTVKQVAALLGYSDKQLRRLCHQGKIRTIQASRRAQHRIPVSALREFFEKNQLYWALSADREFEQTLLAACRGGDTDETPASKNQ